MAIGRSPNSIIPFVLREDRDKPAEQQTTFELGPVPYALRGEFLSRVAGESAKSDDAAMRASMEILPAVLRGWRNFRDADGNPIPFERGDREVFGHTIKNAPTDETLSALTYMQVVELMDAIVDTLQLSGKDRKN